MLLHTSGDSGIIRQIKKSHSIQKLYDDISFKRQVNIIVYLMSVLFCRLTQNDFTAKMPDISSPFSSF